MYLDQSKLNSLQDPQYILTQEHSQRNTTILGTCKVM